MHTSPGRAGKTLPRGPVPAMTRLFCVCLAVKRVAPAPDIADIAVIKIICLADPVLRDCSADGYTLSR